jgi:nucleosome binding factor SPN SPT16 subunit
MFANINTSPPQDFSREVLRIDAIPTKKLDTIKEWLTSVKIKYYESKMNLAWKPILKHILEDPKAFIEEVRALLCVTYLSYFEIN